MTTLVLEQPGSIKVTRSTPPSDLPAGHALVRVRRVGLCGTDWHAYAGRQPFFSYPRVLGHELGVEVEAVNDPASDLRPGDRCAVEPYMNCGRCIACRRGKGNCCTELKVLGVHIDGGMRERIVVPTHKLHRSAKLTLDQLALVETLGIGSHAVARAAVQPGEAVLILGAGPIGLSVIPFVKAAGGVPLVADVSAPRLEFAVGTMGATAGLEAGGDLPAQLQSRLAGDLPTCVIDATGNPASMARTFDLVAHGGRIVFVGLFQGELAFNDPNFHRREVTLLASRNALPDDFTRIIAQVESGGLDTTPWITHRTPAADLPAAMRDWQAPGSGLLKGIVEF